MTVCIWNIDRIKDQDKIDYNETDYLDKDTDELGCSVQ